MLGPRQTGKTTLIKSLDIDLSINLIRPQTRRQYEAHPESLVREIEALSKTSTRSLPLIVIDEVQKIPTLLDTVQDLIDRDIAQFVLSGSSARKLRRSGAVYEVLVDCLIAERIDPLIKSTTQRRLTRSSKYLFFDQGVQRIAAGLGTKLASKQWGHLFEQYVGLELLRMFRRRSPRVTLRFWRDPSGPEVDWVLDHQGEHTPIDVKWNDSPTSKDARHLKLFLKEYDQATVGWIICRIPRPQKIDDQITAIPWQHLSKVLSSTAT